MSVTRFFTWNIGPSSDRLAEQIIRSTMRTHQAGVLTELGGRDRLIRRLAQDFDVAYGDKAHQKKVVLISRRDRFAVPQPRKWTRIIKVGKRTRVGHPGAGPPVVPVKWMPTRRLRDRETGRWVHLFGKHMVASQQLRRRRLLALADLAVTAIWLRSRRGMVIGGGDWNCKPSIRRIRVMARAGKVAVIPLVLGQAMKTHAKAGAIDWFVFRPFPKRWRLVSQTVIPTGTNDHDIYSVTLDINPRKGYR